MPSVAQSAGDSPELQLWPSDAEALSLSWDLVANMPLPVYVLRSDDGRYAVLRRPPRQGWPWVAQWNAETAASKWRIRTGGLMSIRARDQISDMATGLCLGVFRSWIISDGVLELDDGACFYWRAGNEHRHFTDEEGARLVTFMTYDVPRGAHGARGRFCQVDLENSALRSPHCLLLCCFGLHLLADPPGRRWGYGNPDAGA
jgi:hypothetical protein